MKQPAAQAPAVYNAGNHSRQFTIQVPVLNADGTIKLDENGMIIGEEVTERYELNQKHRNQHKAGNGVKSNFFFSTFKKFSFQLISAVCIQHKVGHFCYSL